MEKVDQVSVTPHAVPKQRLKGAPTKVTPRRVAKESAQEPEAVELSPALGWKFLADLFSMTVPQTKALFNEHPELWPAFQENGARVGFMVEAGKPWIRRKFNSAKNTWFGTILEIGALGLGATAGGFLIYNKVQDIRAERGEI